MLLNPCVLDSCLGSDPQVDAGGTGCLGPDSGDQLCCPVLLLLRHRLLWAVAADVPQEGLVLSQNTGNASESCCHRTAFHTLIRYLKKYFDIQFDFYALFFFISMNRYNYWSKSIDIYLRVAVNYLLSVCALSSYVVLRLQHTAILRRRMVWLSTPPGPPSPRSSTSHWSSTCGACPGTLQLRPRCASCLERWWPGESLAKRRFWSPFITRNQTLMKWMKWWGEKKALTNNPWQVQSWFDPSRLIEFML